MTPEAEEQLRSYAERFVELIQNGFGYCQRSSFFSLPAKLILEVSSYVEQVSARPDYLIIPYIDDPNPPALTNMLRQHFNPGQQAVSDQREVASAVVHNIFGLVFIKTLGRHNEAALKAYELSSLVMSLEMKRSKTVEELNPRNIHEPDSRAKVAIISEVEKIDADLKALKGQLASNLDIRELSNNYRALFSDVMLLSYLDRPISFLHPMVKLAEKKHYYEERLKRFIAPEDAHGLVAARKWLNTRITSNMTAEDWLNLGLLVTNAAIKEINDRQIYRLSGEMDDETMSERLILKMAVGFGN